MQTYSGPRLVSFFSSARPWKFESLLLKRHRSGASRPGPSTSDRAWKNLPQRGRRDSRTKRDPWGISNSSVAPASPSRVTTFFEQNVDRWTSHHQLSGRFQSFGIPRECIRPLLSAFVRAVQSGQLSDEKGYELYGLTRFQQDTSGPSMDIYYSTIFFLWASRPEHEKLLLEAGVPQTILSRIQALLEATDRSYPAEEHESARRMHRKVIMHVGPTNSGKTYNALRALAASDSGVYAGPLRLLAHEIWERLNLGQIVPLGMKEEPLVDVAAIDTNSALDVGGTDKKQAMRKLGNPKFSRMCNMRTGEELKIVDDAAPLLSCTVEMLNPQMPYDVGVIDEIQMIADEFRGQAWTSAVLGLCAKELHLCGEETAVPLIQELLKDTGDELIVNRYERLTPLKLGQSMGNDLSQVRKGDCIVAFSRRRIFEIKRQIEKQTSMRCAVVYGMLPPEIRSEQAALFNDPSSGYDVIVGSDAIGMGLNLKIRRVIFDSVTKWDGSTERNLSTSQTKQIAGRAGRYGLHEDSQLGGEAATRRDEDIGFLKDALNTPMQPLKAARIGPTMSTFVKLMAVMGPDTPTRVFYDAHRYISRLPPTLRYIDMNEAMLAPLCEFIDKEAIGLPLSDRTLLTMAPIPWRDGYSLQVIQHLLNMFAHDMNVDLMAALTNTHLLTNLGSMEEQMKAPGKPRVDNSGLALLESLHKVLVMYIWMSFRQPVVWNCHPQAVGLKNRVEKALQWTLQALTLHAGATISRDRDRKRPHYPPVSDRRNSQAELING